MIKNSIIFLSRYCIYLGILLFSILTILTVDTEIVYIATQKDILSNQIVKKGLAEKIDKFLKILKKLLKNKRQLINTSKQKKSMAKLNDKTVINSILNNFKKKDLSI